MILSFVKTDHLSEPVIVDLVNFLHKLTYKFVCFFKWLYNYSVQVDNIYKFQVVPQPSIIIVCTPLVGIFDGEVPFGRKMYAPEALLVSIELSPLIPAYQRNSCSSRLSCPLITIDFIKPLIPSTFT